MEDSSSIFLSNKPYWLITLSISSALAISIWIRLKGAHNYQIQYKHIGQMG
jgi:hypothetical protein